MARGRGGYRPPQRPAAVSGPGALSARTDGGPGQPVRVAPGGGYGDRQEQVAQQQAAPMAVAGGPDGAMPPPGAAAPALGPMEPDGIFGASGRPDEAMTAGLPGQGGADVPFLEPDVDVLLRKMVEVSGHPDLVRLLERRSGR